ncbi:MAG: DUF2807 domain-containing protein [Saprospiraceae bacterium]
MRSLIILLFMLCVSLCTAQVKGNKDIVTKVFDISGVTFIKVQLYADIVIDAAADEQLVITADANLMDLIEKSVEGGQLVLDQKEWIEASQTIKITIGAPQLARIQHGTHETVVVKNLNRPEFSAMAIVGKIILEGKVQTLSTGVEVGQIDAQNLSVPVVDVNIWGWGSVELGSPDLIKGVVKDRGTLRYTGNNTKLKVRSTKDEIVEDRNTPLVVGEPVTEYIEVKIKNNSPNRLQAYVEGPKPDGRKFSYGFPLNPGQVKNEKWTIGTKVYRVSKLGPQKELVEITKADEGKVVELWKRD